MKKPLTVGDLIKELQKFPEDLVVVTPDTEQYQSDFNEVFRVRTVEAFIDEKKWGIRWVEPWRKPLTDIKEYVLLDWS